MSGSNQMSCGRWVANSLILNQIKSPLCVIYAIIKKNGADGDVLSENVSSALTVLNFQDFLYSPTMADGLFSLKLYSLAPWKLLSKRMQ